jgi:competence protein ComEA
MRPLVWKKIKSEKRNETGGFLILLMVVLACYGLRPVTQNASEGPIGLPCDNPVLILVAGDVGSQGIITFCHQPDSQELMNRVGISGSYRWLLDPLKMKTFPSGIKVLVQREGKEYVVSYMEMTAFSKMTLGLPISLNRETEEGLTALPGIGSALAGAIVRERAERGGFKSLDEMTDIKGVGTRLLERIKPFLIL